MLASRVLLERPRALSPAWALRRWRPLHFDICVTAICEARITATVPKD